jgi:LmbE family N-acetylglucosaminyl deacetylase
MKALFIGSHCDDIELGCGGTIAKYIGEWQVICLVLSSSSSFWKNPELKDISSASLHSLGVSDVSYSSFQTDCFADQRQDIWELLHVTEKTLKPDIVFTNDRDCHQDHVVVYEETIRNFRGKTTIAAYKPTIRNCSQGIYNYFEVLSKNHVDQKLKALKMYNKLYKDKIYFQEENVLAQMRVYGMFVETEFAESFRVEKFVR